MTSNGSTIDDEKQKLIEKAEKQLYELKPDLKPDPEKGEAWLAKDCQPYTTQRGEEWSIVSFTRLEGPKYNKNEVSYSIYYDAGGNIVTGGDEESTFVLIDRGIKDATGISDPGVTSKGM